MDCMDTRVAIVTGGARGIGAAITTTLARAGYHVAAGYSTNQTAAEQFTEKLIADGLSLSVHKGNVGEPGDCLRVTEEVLSPGTGEWTSWSTTPASPWTRRFAG
jgi:acetoacetyl-CoA reductase